MSLNPPIHPFAHLDPARRKLAEEKARQRIKEVRDSAPALVAGIVREINRRRCNTLKGFVEHFWHVIEPDTQLVWNWHHEECSDVLEGLESGHVTQDVVANVPPGTMKSLLFSVFFRAWIWRKQPGKRFITGSYGGDLSIRDNVRLRELVKSPEYRLLYPNTQLKGDSKERLDTTTGGWSIATSVGGVGTGEHPDYFIVDDPLTASQAESEAERNTANNWIDRTVSSRGVVRGVKVLLIMQRLHEEDPSGHLLAKGNRLHICFPMRYEVSRKGDPSWTPDPKDHRTVEGELLMPQLFTEEKVKKLELDLGEYGAAGQLQQRPAPEAGGLFKREWWKFLEVAPVKVRRRLRGWDTAATQDGGDYTCGALMSELPDETYVVEDITRGQWSPANVDKVMRTTATMDGVDTPQRMEKEGGGSGKAQAASDVKNLKGFDVGSVNLSGNKRSRARPFRAQVEAGNVFLVRGPWNKAYIDELADFPNAKNDDQVDASSVTFNSLLLEPIREDDWVTW